MAELIYLKNVVTLQLDQGKCTGCGTCLEVCPRQVLSLNGKQARIANRDACMECGACALNCPFGAIAVEAGVGCAAAVINSALGRTGDSCCCVIEPKKSGSTPEASPQKIYCC
jgi:NAD-dependent dihydropyrimidine dehydrogenase PreA subunit